MISDINYIVTLYCGKRRGYNKSKCDEFLKKHIEFINNNLPSIGLVSFVISECDCNYDHYLLEIISKQNLNFNYEIIIRENIAISYGGFSDCIKKNYKDFKYSFIIEDDYIPADKDFLSYFIKKITSKTIYVCSLYVEEHASISNGLINNDLLNDKNIELINNNLESRTDNYKFSFKNQRNFMQNFKSLGFTFSDITDVGYTMFKKPSKTNIPYGNQLKPLLIKPIDF